MAVELGTQPVSQIGEAAGVLWNHLHDHGPLPMTRLVKEVELPRDLLMQALGWLAREDKLAIDDDKRSKLIRLR